MAPDIRCSISAPARFALTSELQRRSQELVANLERDDVEAVQCVIELLHLIQQHIDLGDVHDSVKTADDRVAAYRYLVSYLCSQALSSIG